MRNKHIFVFIFSLLAISFLSVSISRADLLTVHVRALNSTGHAITTASNFTFAIYDDPTGGTKLWEENYTNLIPNSEGRLSQVIGGTTPLSVVTFNESVYLEVSINKNVTSPRIRMTSFTSPLTIGSKNFTGSDYGFPSAKVNISGTLNVTGTLETSNFKSKAFLSPNLTNATDLPKPTATTIGGLYSKTCSGTDKISAIGTDGVPVCSTDQTGSGGSSPLIAMNRTNADISTNSNTTLTNTSLVLWLTAHKNYTIDCSLVHSSAAATTGVAVAIASDVDPRNVSVVYDTWSSATAKVSFWITARNTVAVGTGGSTAASLSKLVGGIQAGTSDHNITISIRSEVSGSAITLKRGSICTLYSNE